MNLSLIFAGGGFPLRDMITVATEAEAAGIDNVYTVEAWRSGLVPLAAIAAATSRIGVGTYVLNARLRTPLLAATAARDLQELSDGRLSLTVGSGNPHMNRTWHGLPPAERPVRSMVEYIQLLKETVHARASSAVDFQGQVHTCQWTPTTDPHPRPVPIRLAAMFPQMLRAAGRTANGAALAAMCGPDYISSVILPSLEEGAERAGRETAPECLAAILTLVDDDRERARKAMRRTICRLLGPPPHPYYHHVLQEQGFGDLATRIQDQVGAGELHKASELIPDELLDTIAVSGTPKDCRTLLAQYTGVVDEAVLTSATAIETTLGHASSEGLVDAYRNVLMLASPR